MKKNLKKSILATTAVLALVSSFISCKQPVLMNPANPLIDDEITNKDIFELQLGKSAMKAESKFGKNIIYFSDVNYADNYVLYRFGPMDDALHGKYIKLPEAPAAGDAPLGFDGTVVEDIVSTKNPMVAGSYTYKLIAKTAIHSARAATAPDISSGSPDHPNEANQDYWANPGVDVIYIPSVAEVRLSVSKSNMPDWGTKMPTPKPLKEGVDYYRGEGTDCNIIYFNPMLNSNEKIYARIEGLDPCFENSIPEEYTTSTDPSAANIKNKEIIIAAKKSDKSDEFYRITLPIFASYYKIYAYNTWSDSVYYPNSEESVSEKSEIYRWPNNVVNLNFTHTPNKTINSVDYEHVFTYKFDSSVPASNYNVIVQRAEISPDPVLYNDGSETDKYGKAIQDGDGNNIADGSLKSNEFISKIENIKLATISEGAGTYTLVDDTAEAGKTYWYFFGGTYTTADNLLEGKIIPVTFRDVKYTKTAANIKVQDPKITLTTRLPGTTDIFRDNIKGEVKFYVKGVGYTDLTVTRSAKGIADEKMTITGNENLGNTYIHFEDTLPWDPDTGRCVVPKYTFTCIRNTTTKLTSDVISFTPDTTSVEPDSKGFIDKDKYLLCVTSNGEIIKEKNPVDSKEYPIHVKKLKVNNDGSPDALNAEVNDTYRNLFKLTEFITSAAPKDKGTITVTYQVKVSKAHNGNEIPQALALIPNNITDKYYVNYLVKDSETGDKWYRGDVEVTKVNEDITFDISNLERNTQYDIVLTLIQKDQPILVEGNPAAYHKTTTN